ncbi:MAG: hypothetical protein MUO26_02070 [Methanotrichaceae archaeon]|nr:hypothetical protein [Methanotrichaceae archaeon]
MRTERALPPEASCSCSSTLSKLNDAGFWRGGKSLKDWICVPTSDCAGMRRKAWSIIQSQ